MKEVNVHEAKTQLSRLLQRVAAGEEVTIANRGVSAQVPADQKRHGFNMRFSQSMPKRLS